VCCKWKSSVPFQTLDAIGTLESLYIFFALCHQEYHKLNRYPDNKREYLDDHISLFHPNPNPLVILVANMKLPAALQAVRDLFISMHVLTEEVLQLLFIVFQFIRAYLNKILQKATQIRQRISQTEGCKLEKNVYKK
jgi:hypothetical protein